MNWTVLGRAMVGLVLSPVVLTAQGAGYRIDFERYPSGLSRMIFVNGSSRDVDAFHVVITCKSFKHEEDRDVLGGPNNGCTTIHAAGGIFEVGTAFEENGDVCAANVDAVIYSDGSFDGPLEVVRRMHAAREGGLAAIRFWAGLIEHQQLSDDEALSAVSARRVQNDRTHLANCRSSGSEAIASLACSYWAGRLHVDRSVSSFVARATAADAPVVSSAQRLEDYVFEWQQKYENDVAMTELSKSFPPVGIN
jgi:hypothetical protein